MRKLRLELESLAVESFATGAGNGKGTVRGHETEGETALIAGSCVNTCQVFCAASNQSADTHCGGAYTAQAGCTANTNCGQNTCYCQGTAYSYCNQNTCLGSCDPLLFCGGSL